MPLEEEIASARRDISPDGYEMSIGEIMSLYKDGEIKINPAYQRLFRWSLSQKTRFIESLLLGIPIPPIFVFTTDDGKWELIDGLQRLSTILQFAGVLRDDPEEDEDAKPLRLLGTTFLPSLNGKSWGPSPEDAVDWIGTVAQLQVRRARLRVEILRRESDPLAKYELFQRLNTGGTKLSEQEVRNCVAIMLNPGFFTWMQTLATDPEFTRIVIQTEEAKKKQAEMELIVRFLAFRNIDYRSGLDVHEYLDAALIKMANNKEFPANYEAETFRRTFSILCADLGVDAFKRWNGTDFTGKFLISVFEVVAYGVSLSLDSIEALGERRQAYLLEKVRALWQNETFVRNSGAGVRGTTRLANLLPFARTYFQP
jgi:hypothetical protein